MESRDERFKRENKHFKKQMKKFSGHKRNKARRLDEVIEEKNWKNKVMRDESDE